MPFPLYFGNVTDMELSIARIYYPVKCLGPGMRVGIWTAGCERRCQGCISPELQSFAVGRELSTKEILDMLRMIPETPDGFTISGGEPFARPEALCRLLEAISKISDDIILFTGYTRQELAALDNPSIARALALCAVLIDGPYVQTLNDGVGLRGSSNQVCHVFRHKERYQEIAQAARELQTILYAGKLLTIGIP